MAREERLQKNTRVANIKNKSINRRHGKDGRGVRNKNKSKFRSSEALASSMLVGLGTGPVPPMYRVV